MTLARIEGQPTVCTCSACGRNGIGGTLPYHAASTGELRHPEDWYADEVTYCSSCASKLVGVDATRSRSRFYLDTYGLKVDPEILREVPS